MSSEPMNAGTKQTGNSVENEKSKANLAENEAPMTLEKVRAEVERQDRAKVLALRG